MNAPIVIFHKDYPLNPAGINAGAETATVMLARALSSLGERVFVAAHLSEEFLLSKGIRHAYESDGVSYIDLTSSFDTTRIFEDLASVHNVTHFHLVVACRGQALLESRYNPQVLSRLFISHEPSASAFGVQPRVIGEVADRVICVSQAQAKGVIDAGCSRESVVVIPNGVDLEVFQVGEPAQRDYSKLVFAGALVVDKGVHILVEAYSKLKSKYPQLTLDIYGSSALWGRDDYFDIETVVSSLPGLTAYGAVAQIEIARAFRKAGILVLPSIYFDSFNMVALEGQVSGLPVIGSTNGGMSEIIQDGITGKLLSDISSESLALAIESLITNPQQLQEMSRASLAARDRFSWNKTAQQILELARNIDNNDNQHTISVRQDVHKDKLDMTEKERKVAIVTTYNQCCGLATYAAYLTEQFRPGEFLILAEDVDSSEIIQADESFVRRCWKRGESDFSNLERVIREKSIDILHLNCQYRFFRQPVFSRFLIKMRGSGVKVIAHIHNPFTKDEQLRALVRVSDRVIVHTPENKLEVMGNGAEQSRVSVIEHGVALELNTDKAEARARLNISLDETILVCFGFIQAHKGIDEVIQAVAQLKTRHPSLRLYILGQSRKDDPHSQDYLQALKISVRQLGLDSVVTFLDSFVPESMLRDFIIASDSVVMNYRSQYYEASGAVAIALGCGAAIIGSTAPAFSRLGDAIFHVTTGYPLDMAIELVTTDKALNNTIRANALAWAHQNSWSNMAKKFARVYQKVRVQEDFQEDLEWRNTMDEHNEKATISKHTLRVLMQNRSNAYTHPGGDTVLMDRIAAELRKLDIIVDIDVEGKSDVSEYDIVHLYNFATPEITENYARAAVTQDVPFVVSTMYEDLPSFYNQMYAHFEVLKGYIKLGQKREKWDELASLAKNCTPARRFENTWTANHAAALIVSGEREKAQLLSDYPSTAYIEICKYGSEVGEPSGDMVDNGNSFINEIGVKDFVLCVGRLETRKNQLSILKALEDSELTLVFATGGFTYQPDYEEACRRFKRAGKTIFLERMDERLLSSAYLCARVHVSASWYELPGIVSMEAARHGTNIVVTDCGTPRDYFGNGAYYCKPDDIDSIYNAIIAAYYAPTRAGLRESVENCSWRNAAKTVLEVYKKTLSQLQKKTRSSYQSPDWMTGIPDAKVEESLNYAKSKAESASLSVAKIGELVVDDGKQEGIDLSYGNIAQVQRASELCNIGDELLRSGDVMLAMKHYEEAIELAPLLGRPLRSKAIAELQQGEITLARNYIEKALKVDPSDAKSHAALGSCFLAEGNKEDAFACYKGALEKDPNNLILLTHVINVAYPLGRLEELEIILEKFVKSNPNNLDMQYCLAGCLFKQQKIEPAKILVDIILERDVTHIHAIELRDIIDKSASETTSSLMLQHSDAVESELQELETWKEQKQYTRIISSAKRIADSSEPSNAQKALAQTLLAEALALSGNLQEAEEAFRLAEQNRTYRSRALTGRGAICAATSRFEEAKECFSEALEIFPNSDSALAGLGMCAVNSSEIENAWQYYQQALAKNPENMRALLGVIELGYQLKKVNDIESALTSYLEIHPADISILYSFAGALFSQGRYDEASEQLNKIFIFEPDNEMARELDSEIARRRTTVNSRPA